MRSPRKRRRAAGGEFSRTARGGAGAEFAKTVGGWGRGVHSVHQSPSDDATGRLCGRHGRRGRYGRGRRGAGLRGEFAKTVVRRGGEFSRTHGAFRAGSSRKLGSALGVRFHELPGVGQVRSSRKLRGHVGGEFSRTHGAFHAGSSRKLGSALGVVFTNSWGVSCGEFAKTGGCIDHDPGMSFHELAGVEQVRRFARTRGWVGTNPVNPVDPVKGKPSAQRRRSAKTQRVSVLPAFVSFVLFVVGSGGRGLRTPQTQGGGGEVFHVRLVSLYFPTRLAGTAPARRLPRTDMEENR